MTTNLIAIHGRIGSGKDETGKIIQYLLDHRINTTHPQAQDEDDHFTFMDFETWKEKGYAQYSKWEIKKFAYKLKFVCSILTGIPIEDFEKNDVKDNMFIHYKTGAVCNRNFIPVGDVMIENVEVLQKFIDNQDFNIWVQVRVYMQYEGTELGRKHRGTDCWVNALFADYKSSHFMGVDPADDSNDVHVTKVYPNWIITDLRFPNEMQAVKDHGGITISVRRPGTDVGSTHPSETSLDNAEFDYIIQNDGTIKDLIRKVTVILIGEKILTS